jgi:hypothetical protein
MLNNYSKLKLLIHKLIQRYPDKKERKKIVKNFVTVQNWDSDTSESLKSI